MSKWKQLKDKLLGDGNGDTSLNQTMKRKQQFIGVVVLVILVLMIIVLYGLSHRHQSHKSMQPSHKKTAVDGVLSTDFTQKNALSALEKQQEQVNQIQQSLKQLHQQLAKQQTKQQLSKQSVYHVVQEILKKRESQAALPHSNLIPHLNTSQPFSALPLKTPRSITRMTKVPTTLNMVNPDVIHQVQTIQFHYAKQPSVIVGDQRPPTMYQQKKTPKNYVPAGTFATAVLLEGADANASVNGQSNTVGILLRILDPGTLPNGHHSYLKGCFVLASIYGDISSERGEARLTKLSCTRRDGSILERKVEGYLSFSGKEGIKGHPVMRNGKILAMAGVSGFLSGIGSALQQSIQTQSISPLGVTATVSPSKVWENGAYGGASTAMSQLAHYYIQRADQYHPIIEIGSGTVATIIFQQGFSLTDNTARHASSIVTPSTQTIKAVNHQTQTLHMLLKKAQALSANPAASPFTSVN